MRAWTNVGVVAMTACSEGTTSSATTDTSYAAREAMVRTQIAARGVRDARVLDALMRVPRHELVPEAARAESYADHPLEIGHQQTISQPYIVALMTELADITHLARPKVLEIGTGSGYQSAVLATLGADVYSIEIVAALAERAQADLTRLGYEVHVRQGDGYRGWPEEAPFDAILVTAAPEIPAPLLDQLKVGGRLVVPVGVGTQELVVITRHQSGLRRERVTPVRFVPMTGEAQEQQR